MYKIAFKLLVGLQTVRYCLANWNVPRRFILANVPYFSQWESRELVSRILRGDMRADDDPYWQRSGAESKIEYALWSRNACGMACLKMILAHRNDVTLPLVILGKRSMSYEAYDQPLDASIGLKYGPFVRFLDQEFDVRAKSVAVLTTSEIISELVRGNYVIASVSSMIRDPKSVPGHKGGHLVLIVGYDLTKRILYIHNSSGGSMSIEEYSSIEFRDFHRFFANRGIVIDGMR